ncbi:MATE family efflux transporter [Clostridium algidicarnis]|uniref:Probable multidrug resistance protein NorM n=2 Tax=Clostridium algidicarnis TaxID=37659 RepID=A0A2S6FV68_9CLOT|nr:MATE family efflux transporter [Clostridium algidicarnis]MBB6697002.1 MATE family efflux transporter [Clostridium algidicarnis]MBU3197036.1 MATE family efflux transporter [Clostridium algidicarnis]MBU3219097.1 MATE family efflux transporter [Clostridium algidicarnis]PPK45568.1 putative MATE family efflux protein [Clostridium algidicarnis DSM 15099]
MSWIRKNKENISIIFALAIPIIIENILQTLLGTVDTYFAGQINDNAIAAIGVTNLIINIFIAFYTAISIGTSAIVSRNFGRVDYTEANSAIKQSNILGITLGLLVGIISFVFYKPILMVSGVSPDLINYTSPYYMIVVVPSVFLCLSLILSSCLRSTKDTKTPMIATGIANVLNIVLNMLFIKLGLGIFGLGLATTISRIIGVLILTRKLMKGEEIKLDFKNMRIKKDVISSILKIGIPAGVEKLVMRIGQLVYNSMIISIGISAYVAHNIAGNIESYTYIPAMGFGVATATLVGISLGENNIKKAKSIVFLSDIIATAFMLCFGVIFFIFARTLASIFTDTKEVQDMVVIVLRLIAIFQPFAAITQIFTSALQGAGDTKFPMYATLIGIWCGRVGVGYILGVVCGLGLLGVWMGYALDITFRAILLLIRFLNGKWQEICI